VPLFDTDTHLTREEFEAAARPLLDRTIGLMANVVGRAGGTCLAGLYLVGGSSRIPLIATLLHQRLGVAPTLIDTPELLVAQGSLRAVPAQGPGFAPSAPAGYPPPAPAHGRGFAPSAPAGFAPAAPFAPPSPAAPVSTPPGGPVSTPPGGPVSTLPGGPVSAPALGIPTSGVPTSGAPGDPGGLPPVPAGMPLWGNASATQAGPPYGQAPYGGPAWYGAPGMPDPTRRHAQAARRSPVRWIVAAAAALVLLGGVGAVTAVMLAGDDNDAGGNPAAQGGGTGKNGDANQIQPANGAKLGDGGAAQSGTYTVNKTVWYQGLKVTVKTVSYDQANVDKPLSMDVSVENVGTDGQNNVRYTEVYFASDGTITEGRVEEIQSLPGKATSNGTFVFKPQKAVTDLRKGELSIGGADEVQPKIPFGDLTKTVALEPKKVAGPVDEQRSGVLGMKLNQCEQRADYPAKHHQAKKDYMMVVCDVDLKSYKEGIYDHGVWESNFRLKLPDGTTTSPEQFNAVLLSSNDLEQGVPLSFVIRWPASGAYVLQFYDAGRLGGDPPDDARPIKEVPMTLT
jgi:hypothetical protein